MDISKNKKIKEIETFNVVLNVSKFEYIKTFKLNIYENLEIIDEIFISSLIIDGYSSFIPDIKLIKDNEYDEIFKYNNKFDFEDFKGFEINIFVNIKKGTICLSIASNLSKILRKINKVEIELGYTTTLGQVK